MSQRTKKQCSIDGCEKTHHARGYCDKHYQRFKTHGDPNGGRARYSSAEESFAARTQWEGDCLIWVGSKRRDGYGVLSDNGKRVTAHRYAWEQSKGPVPEGMFLDHTCYRRDCANVYHLRLATQVENNRNLSGPIPGSRTGHRNVYPRGNAFGVIVKKLGKEHHFGTFSTVEEAAEVAEQARRKLFGEFAGRG